MTTTTTQISCDGGFEAVSKWKHPTDTQAKNIFKFNLAGTVANGSILATITALFLACVSSFVVLGLVLTALAGFSYLLSADVAKVTLENIQKPDGWTPLVFEIGTTGIGWHRCFPSTPVAAPSPADRSDGGMSDQSLEEKHNQI
jgi:hypothetical protein